MRVCVIKAAAASDSVMSKCRSAGSMRISRDGCSARIEMNDSVPRMTGEFAKEFGRIERRRLRFPPAHEPYAFDFPRKNDPQIRGVAFARDPFPRRRQNLRGMRSNPCPQCRLYACEQRNLFQLGGFDQRLGSINAAAPANRLERAPRGRARVGSAGANAAALTVPGRRPSPRFENRRTTTHPVRSSR